MKRVALAVLLASCAGPSRAPSIATPTASSAPTASASPIASATASAATAPPPRVTLIAAGDVEMARVMGQNLLHDPSLNPFTTVASLLASADIRFANLEGPLSDQHGETMSPQNHLIFTGPPSGADALARGGFTIVSTANNHAWDYGKGALGETIDNLDRVGVLHVGTGRTRADAYKHVVVEKRGVRVAFVAVTDVFNHGPLEKHEAAEYIARADPKMLADAIAAARKDADFVVVSYHGGDEYNDAPLTRARTILHGAIDAGADIVLGHHPHVVQGVERYAGKPIVYSLGNLLMQMHKDHPWTGYGFFARVTLAPGDAPAIEACPYRIVGLAPLPFAGDPGRAAFEGVFFSHLREVSAKIAPIKLGAPGADGCAPILASPPPGQTMPLDACAADEVLVPATPPEGFVMGHGTARAHRVVLTHPVCFDANETTVAKYKECVDAGACKPPLQGDPFATYPRLPDHPVNMTSWVESRAYCTWRGKRLPTEAEWEWAAGGPTMTKFPWGDAPEASCDTCDFTKWGAPKWKPGGDVGCHGGGTSPVGAHPKGDKTWPGGSIHDLSGNVYEWVEDSFAAYPLEAETDPIAHTDTLARVLRGGAWNRSYSAMEVTHRAASVETYKVPGIGVRCVRTP